jgi:hypothetical protein
LNQRKGFEMEPKVLVYEVPDGTNRKMYLCADSQAQDYIVTMERDGEPTGFRVPLHLMQIELPGMPTLPIDWNKALTELQYIQVFGETRPTPA